MNKKLVLWSMVIGFALLGGCSKNKEAEPAPVAETPTVLYAIENGILAFGSTADYTNAVEKQNAKERESFINAIQATKNYVSFSRMASRTNGRTLSEPETELLENDFLSAILNEDRIVAIGNYYYKIDMTNSKVYALSKKNKASFADFKNGNTANTDVLEFSINDDVLMIIQAMEEEGLTTTPSGRTQWKIKWPCFSGGYAFGNKDSGYDYPAPPINPSYRMDNKLVYQQLGIYYSLQSKTKSESFIESSWKAAADPNQKIEVIELRWKERCGGEGGAPIIIRDGDAEDALNYRPYESTRSLQWYTFKAYFYCRFNTKDKSWRDYREN